jgi:hypothetical protein
MIEGIDVAGVCDAGGPAQAELPAPRNGTQKLFETAARTQATLVPLKSRRHP